MIDHLNNQFKIWAVVAATQFAGVGLAEWNLLASIIAYICGAVASLSIAFYWIRKK